MQHVSMIFSLRFAVRLGRELRQHDVIHVHFARELVPIVTVTAARLMGKPVIVQTHGMVVPDKRHVVRLLDAVIVSRLLRGSASVLYLTQAEKTCLIEMVGQSRACSLQYLPNVAPPASSDLAWDSRNPLSVTFCARVHPRKRAHTFLDMITLLHEQGLTVDAFLIGPDGGESAAVIARVSRDERLKNVHVVGSIERTDVLKHLRETQVLVLPSRDEPFPMVVLEAMSVGTPVVVTESCGLAELLVNYDAGAVSDGCAEDLANLVSRILTDPVHRDSLVANAYSLLREKLSPEATTSRLTCIYRDAVKSARGLR